MHYDSWRFSWYERLYARVDNRPFVAFFVSILGALVAIALPGVFTVALYVAFHGI